MSTMPSIRRRSHKKKDSEDKPKKPAIPMLNLKKPAIPALNLKGTPT
ncbi:hypothetical protein KIPB_016190, partial [Kipferlia bialata]|eukprot:g16190.t1